jgi:RNA polymerase sigma-70 factor (ECF subfamily)
MTSAADTPETPEAAFDRLLGELRPKLHRYCARMTGSVIDGEDVVQEALVKAIEAYPSAGPIALPEPWLFRIAHNASLDHLRRRARREAIHAEPARAEEEIAAMADPIDRIEEGEAAAASLRAFMELPTAQRSSVILADLLGYTIREVGDIIDATVPAVKAALHRGRERLRALADAGEDAPLPALAAADRVRLQRYIDHFNARDFDALRAMLVDEIKLELVNRRRMTGRGEVGSYFTRYSGISHFRLVPGLVDGNLAALVCDADADEVRPRYFILFTWDGDRIAAIRDFHFARYALDGAAVSVLRG